VHARQISYFLAVVEHGGFGRAAAALQIAQPSLSQSVRTLERDMGADLFRRAPHGVVLTAAGRALLGPARQLVRDLAAARDAVGGTSGPSVVDLVACRPLGTYPGAALVASFAREHPGVRVRLDRADLDDRLAALVRDGSSELGLTYLPNPRADLTSIELGVHELMLAFRPEDAPPPGPVPLTALAGTSLVGSHRGSRARALVESELRDAGVRTRVVVEVAQRDTALDLVAAGVAATFVVDATEAATRARGLEVRPVDPPMRMRFGFVHRHRPLSDAATAFVAHALFVTHGTVPAPPEPPEGQL
jgi:DNA-binding transcriptional LysR family regulator